MPTNYCLREGWVGVRLALDRVAATVGLASIGIEELSTAHTWRYGGCTDEGWLRWEASIAGGSVTKGNLDHNRKDGCAYGLEASYD